MVGGGEPQPRAPSGGKRSEKFLFSALVFFSFIEPNKVKTISDRDIS